MWYQVNLLEQGDLLRQDEFVVWQGRRKCSRRVFLFEDLVLFSKTKKRASGTDCYVYKNCFKVRLEGHCILFHPAVLCRCIAWLRCVLFVQAYMHSISLSVYLCICICKFRVNWLHVSWIRPTHWRLNDDFDINEWRRRLTWNVLCLSVCLDVWHWSDGDGWW